MFTAKESKHASRRQPAAAGFITGNTVPGSDGPTGYRYESTIFWDLKKAEIIMFPSMVYLLLHVGYLGTTLKNGNHQDLFTLEGHIPLNHDWRKRNVLIWSVKNHRATILELGYLLKGNTFPIGSMYGIFSYIYHIPYMDPMVLYINYM